MTHLIFKQDIVDWKMRCAAHIDTVGRGWDIHIAVSQYFNDYDTAHRIFVNINTIIKHDIDRLFGERAV